MKKIISALLAVAMLLLYGCSQTPGSQTPAQPLAKDDLFVFSDGRKMSSPEGGPLGITFSEEDAPMDLETKRGLRIGDSIGKCQELYAGLPCVAVPDGEGESSGFNMTDYLHEDIGEIGVIAGKHDIAFIYGTKDGVSIDAVDLLNIMAEGYERSFDVVGFLIISFEDGYVSDVQLLFRESLLKD